MCLAFFVERAWEFEDLLVLLVIVALGAKFINNSDDMIWSAVAILTRLGSFWPITTTVPMVTVVVVAAVAMASVVRAIVVTVRRALSACILIEAHLGFLGVGVLVGSSDHFADTGGRLVVEFGAKLAMVESSDEGGDDLSFRDVGNRIPHLRKASDVAMEELRRLLVDVV